jgi:hypothetical protein
VAQLSSPATHDDIGRSATSHGHEVHPISPCPRPNPSPARSLPPPPPPRLSTLRRAQIATPARIAARSSPAARYTASEDLFVHFTMAIFVSRSDRAHLGGDLLQNLHNTRPSVIQQICLPMLGLQLCHSDPDLISIELTMNCFQI